MQQFCYQPGHEHGCGHSNCCPHLGGASVGMLVQITNTSGKTTLQLHLQLDSERKRISGLVDENQRLENELQQAKLELKLERQNKFATAQQQNEEAPAGGTPSAGADDSSVNDATKPKKRGAPVGHAGWYRTTPTQYDILIDVASPRRCPHCRGHVTADALIDAVDHLQEDIIDNVYRVVCYRHPAGRCDDCGSWVQQPGKGEILGSRIGPKLRSTAVWLRNDIGISYRKIPQIIEEMFGVTFTPAALIGFETMLADRAEPIVDDIAKKLGSSDGAVHADETYWTTDGARSYFWVHGDLNYIHFQYDTSRAGRVSREILGDDFTGTLVTDCYSGYFASAAGAKQKCLAHLARQAHDWQKLTAAGSLDEQFFSDLKQFVKRACTFHRQREKGQLSDDEQTVEKVWLRTEQQRLETSTVNHEKALKLQARLVRHTLEWLVFLDDERVPPTNNLAERALRPLVVLRKITFGSRSNAGAKQMAQIMTVGQTARRHGHRSRSIYYELYTRPPDRVLKHLYTQAR